MRKWVGHTGVVLALDGLPSGCRDPGCLEKLMPLFSGVKVGLPLLLREGPRLLRRVAEVAQSAGILRIADFKLADIGDVMSSSLEAIRDLGYDIAIAHAFVGVRGALEDLVVRARELGIEVLLVTSMSHEGSREFYDKHFREFLEVARELNVWGVVVPATRLHLVSEARKTMGGSVRILSPGVGVQGARYGTAICHGADYEIVGRSVIKAPDPLEAATRIVEEVERVVRSCRTSSA